MATSPSEKVWNVFAYGSLVWRPDFAYSHEYDGYVEGFARRFWQGSPDHRGTPDRPGRVVTMFDVRTVKRLEGSSDTEEVCKECVYGKLYCIQGEARIAEVREYLLEREKAGFAEVEVRVRCPADDCTRTATVFMALPENDHFLGYAPAEEIAETIAKSHGPSGPNRDYFVNLLEALRRMRERLGSQHACVDPHLLQIQNALV